MSNTTLSATIAKNLKADNKEAASLANTIAALAEKSALMICKGYGTDKTGELSYTQWTEARAVCASGYDLGYAERLNISLPEILKDEKLKKKLESARNNHMKAIRDNIESTGVEIKKSDKAEAQRKAVSRADVEKAEAKALDDQKAYQAIEARMKQDPTLTPSMAALELKKGELGAAHKMEKAHKRVSDAAKREEAAAHRAELDTLKKDIDSEIKRLFESINIPHLNKALAALKRIK